MCHKCEGFGGLWQETPAGLRRCDCAAGAKLTGADEARAHPVARPPVLRAKDCEVFVEMLSAIPFFPAETGARLLVAEEIRSMCATASEALDLVRRMARLYTRWPGMKELRRVYCSAAIPLDGLIDSSISEVYPDGIPARCGAQEAHQLSAAPMKQLRRLE